LFRAARRSPHGERQCQQVPARQASGGVCGRHQRDGADDPVGKVRLCAMTKTYREMAIEDMLGTVEEAMSQVLDWWGELPPAMKDAIQQFRTQLGAAIDSVEFVKRALDRQAPETDRGGP